MSVPRAIHSHTMATGSGFFRPSAFSAGYLAAVLCWFTFSLSPLVSLAQENPKAIAEKELGEQKQATSALVQPTSDTLVLIAPLISEYVYLADATGKIVHQWQFNVTGNNAYLYPDGTLMRLSQEPEIDLFDGRGSAGRIQKVDWQGNLLWDFKYSSKDHLQHHDFELLPNGNVLLIDWVRMSREEALQAGRDPEKLGTDELYSERIVEIQPKGLTDGDVVWEWRLWDHLVQDHDESLPNYGKPSEHPRRVDINFMRSDQADWIHMNAVDYHPEFDQIIMSARYFDEFWIIDHSTSKEEASSSQGGKYGHGGDLLYRLGNPMSYQQGDLEDKILFGQHNCMWIPKGFPGEGDVTLFNNGTSEPRTGYSSADQLRLPVDDAGIYRMSSEHQFEAPKVVWSYSRGPEMFSFRISGAERLANGNTLICSGHQPWILEVAPDKTVVWENQIRYGGADGKTPNAENGAMFRAPGYTASYFNQDIQAKLNAN